MNPKMKKLKKHEIPKINEFLIELSVRELKYSLTPIENASANKLDNPIITIDCFMTCPAIPPLIIANEVTSPSTAPSMRGRMIVLSVKACVVRVCDSIA